MNFPYPTVTNFTSSVNTAYYFNADDLNVYEVNTNISESFFGKSEKDIVEFSYYNLNGVQNGWSYKQPKIIYISDVGNYIDVDYNKVNYSYRKTKTDYISNNNNFLIDIQSDFSSSNVFDGQHVASYNFIRNVAGNPTFPLIISDISPSRTELKLIPSFNKIPKTDEELYQNLYYESFIKKLVLVNDIVDNLNAQLFNYNCDSTYKSVKETSPESINTFKDSFGFKNDQDAITFINNVYNGIDSSTIELFNKITFKNLFGVKNFIKYWLYTYSKNIISFNDLYVQIKYIVQKEYVNQLNVINFFNVDLTDAINLITSIVWDQFVQIEIKKLEYNFLTKFYSYYKNGINFGDGVITKFLDHSYDSSNESDDVPATLLIKLDSPLSLNYSVKSTCWISNISITPFVQNVILIKETVSKNYKISGPNFSVKIVNSNQNTIDNVSSLDPNLPATTESEININKKLAELDVDYSDFANFVLFSSAALRIKIFKNKLNRLDSLDNTLKTISSALTSSTVALSASYSSEFKTYTSESLSIKNNFDGFECYLYRSQSLVSGTISDASSNYYTYVYDAEEYDINNRDSLINNTPEYIKMDENNNDYLVFLSMVGHHFDNIYQYIKSFPILSSKDTKPGDSYLPDIIYYLLNSFGWNTSTDFANKSLVTNYLDTEYSGSQSISAKDKNELVWKRILDTLPYIYKTKGTTECINLLMSCYGIPLNILNIREFGGSKIENSKVSSYLYDEKYFFTKYNSNNEYVEIPYLDSAKSLEFTFKLNKDYNLNDIVDLTSKDTDWKIYLKKTRQDEYGNIYFSILDKSIEIENVPIFNKDRFYNVLLRRNDTSSFYDTTTDENYVPTKYDLVIKSNQDDRESFSKSGSIFLTRTYNQLFVESGFLYFGNYTNSSNKFTGILDKINLIKNPITDDHFDQYSKNFNFYGNPSVKDTWDDLLFRYNYDYPINLGPVSSSSQLIASTNSGSVILPVEVSAVYYRAVATYTQPSLNVSVVSLPDPNYVRLYWYPLYYGNSYQLQYASSFIGPWTNYGPLLSNPVPISPDFPEGKVGISGSAYNFNYNSVTQSNSCTSYSQSVFPYQFDEVDIVQASVIPQYGPNKYNNEKVRRVEQTLLTQPSPIQSVARNLSQLTPDSNLLGVFVSPFKVKDDDIIDFLGDYDIVDDIADPGYLYESKYKSLQTLSEAYYQYRGETVLYQEFMTVFRSYFDTSVFDVIKNVIPARVKLLTGVLIEPSILERPKLQYKPIVREVVPPIDATIEKNPSPIKMELEKSDKYESTIICAEKIGFSRPSNLNKGYIPDTLDNYYLFSYNQGGYKYFDSRNLSVSYLYKVTDYQDVYTDNGNTGPVSYPINKIISVPDGTSYNSNNLYGDPYITNISSSVDIYNLLPVQHLSYKNKPLSKFSVYLTSSLERVNLFYPPNGEFRTKNYGTQITFSITNTNLGLSNFDEGSMYVKSRNSNTTTIISQYEITGSGVELNYNPVLTQSLSLSQSVFVI